MIVSGSHSAGIDAADFRLPPGTALRYEQPALPLRRFFPSYVVLDSVALDPAGRSQWMLPAWGQIWIVLTDGQISVGIGNRHYQRLGTANVYGVTSRAMPVTSHGGVTIAIDVSPLGWARLFGATAKELSDRVTPLDHVLPPEWVEDLLRAMHASDRCFDVKAVLDGFLASRLPPPHADENTIRQIMELLADPELTSLSDAAARIGIDGRTLCRLTKRFFGFPPKLLMMRYRFLRAFFDMYLDGDPVDRNGLPPGYFDASHFNRDGQRFLGMTPKRFAKLDLPYLRAALRARMLVCGSPTPALDKVDPGSGIAAKRTVAGDPSGRAILHIQDLG